MRRVRFYEYGGPEVLTVEEVEEPAPAEGQVRIRVEAIGASFVDTVMRAGTSAFGQPPLPGSPHGDVLGTVDAVGAGVDPSWTGRRVVALVAADAYADVVLADADWLAPVPDGMAAAQASNLAMPGPVALGVLRAGRVVAGEAVLVHAAAGNIGHLATQLAKLEGAGPVIATAGSAAKREFALAHGADVAISYADPDWAEQVRAAAPGGVDVALDSIGGAVSATTLGLLAPRGRLVVYGAATGELPQLPVGEIFGLRSVTGFGMLAFRTAFAEEARAHIAEITAHVAGGRLRTAVASTVPLSEPAKAHEALEDRDRLGRVLLVP
jgi:NADPH2:quinone reductase